jgi:predicted Rossmann fold flavoprotein
VAAIFAAEGPAPVLVLERTADGGRKILISGGGRCNILPSRLAPERFVTDSAPSVMRGMLRAWPLAAQRRFFEDEVGLPLALEQETGKLFPRSNRARDVRDGLVALARRRGVQFIFDTSVTGIAGDGEAWRVETSAGGHRASRVMLATGGLSVPLTGSDGTGLRLAKALGHRMHATYPALTPLTVDASNTSGLHPSQLAGVSLDVRLRAKRAGQTSESHGGFLFTHRGYSGPAVLDVSHVCVRSVEGIGAEPAMAAAAVGPRGADARAALRVSWSEVSAAEWESRLMEGDVHAASILARVLPERLALFLLASAGVPRDRRTSSLRRPERTALVEHLTAYALSWSGHEGYRKAEVTGGGVALSEVNTRTLESRHHRGLYLCGEMLDAFGPIGGHNFTWAWSTGRTAGTAAASGASSSG